MLETDYLTGRSVAISVSESDDLAASGFTELHLADAFGELCRHLLADGGSLLYGGDLRREGYTNLLTELIERHRPVSDSGAVFTSVLPWPVHMGMSDRKIASHRNELPRGVDMICLSLTGEPIRGPGEGKFDPTQPTKTDWHAGLHSMRRFVTDKSDLRILLGGRSSKYMGSKPGVAEEALISLTANKPIFLAGGFGGCTADICEALDLLPIRRIKKSWPGIEEFSSQEFRTNNGLSKSENEQLARTPHIDEVIALILRGVARLFQAAAGKR